MNYTEEKYNVDAILNKRVKKGKVEYLLRWEGCTDERNEWVPVQMMDCEDLVLKFETSRFHEIIGVKIVASGFEYAVINRMVHMVSSAKALEMWSDDLIDFLENRIVFEMPNESAEASPEIQLSRNVDVSGLPDEIIGCTNFNDDLKYLCEWKNYSSALQLVSSSDAKTHFGHLVVRFLESNLDCPPFRYPNGMKMMTRALKKIFESNNISVDAKVKIVRHVGLEKAMVRNSAAKIIDRRATISTGRAVDLKMVKNIPFGARGRKRQTVNVAFIGLQPNPDGRNLVVAGTSTGTGTVLAVTPGRRTYSRATSTPLPRTAIIDPQLSLVDSPNNLTVSNPRDEDTTFEDDWFDSMTTGCLHYPPSD